MEEKGKLPPPPSNKREQTSITQQRIANSNSSKKSIGVAAAAAAITRSNRKMENTSSGDLLLRNYSNVFSWTTDAQDYVFASGSTNNYFSYLYEPNNESDPLYYYNVSSFSDSTNDLEKKRSCQWEAAQHSLFQFSNICFLSASIIPRHYKCGILLFRILTCVSFVLSAIWAGVHFCAVDWFVWSSALAVTNGVHALILTFKFFPPALSLELTELYIRMFKPLKVSKKHFKELTKEACLLRLAPGETYAIEEVTPADEKLSILLKGRLKVSCNDTFLHSISCYQFIDSPEWLANTTANGTRFQVTITAEEDCLYLNWCRLKLDRIFRHRPQVKFVFNNLIGKDITHKMYSLNEQIGHICTSQALSRAAKDDHWRRSMNRSVSVDAVDTGTRGHVRSTAYKHAEKYRKNSIHSESESPLLGQQQCWYPIVASQFPAEYPFILPEENEQLPDGDKIEPMLAKNQSKEDTVTTASMPTTTRQHSFQNPQFQLQLSQYTKLVDTNVTRVPLLNVNQNRLLNTQPVALIPVIVPVAVGTSGYSAGLSMPGTTTGRTASLKRQKEVKFDETKL